MEGAAMSNGRKVIEGLADAVLYANGGGTDARVRVVRVPNKMDVRAIREKLGLTQEEFAFRFGFSLGTLRHWEQGERYPHGSARVLLAVINRSPQAVEEALTDDFRAAS
jgi:putative transcriptional regulator